MGGGEHNKWKERGGDQRQSGEYWTWMVKRAGVFKHLRTLSKNAMFPNVYVSVLIHVQLTLSLPRDWFSLLSSNSQNVTCCLPHVTS